MSFWGLYKCLLSAPGVFKPSVSRPRKSQALDVSEQPMKTIRRQVHTRKMCLWCKQSC